MINGAMKSIAKFAKTQPQAAYAAFIHGEVHRFSYFLRTIPSMGDLLQPLDEAIEYHLLPAIIGTNNITQPERNLYFLPIRLGGLGTPSRHCWTGILNIHPNNSAP